MFNELGFGRLFIRQISLYFKQIDLFKSYHIRGESQRKYIHYDLQVSNIS